MSAGRQANQMRFQAAMMAGLVGKPRIGIVSSYDGSPGGYQVKVRIQPEDYETGWLPIEVIQGGNGWGVYAAPHAGDQAVIHFLEGDKEVGWCSGFLPNDVDAAPAVPEGEVHLIHKQGQFLKLLSDGSIALSSTVGINLTGPTTITGTLHVTQDVTLDTTLTASTDVVGGGKSLKSHVHTGVQTGSGVSGPPQ